MLVRSSRYLQALVERDHAQVVAEQARRKAREVQAENDRLRREAQEAKDDYLHRLLHQHVIVHVKEPELSVEGFIVGVYNDSIAVQNARVPITPAGDVQQLDGLQIFPKTQIGWVTELNA